VSVSELAAWGWRQRSAAAREAGFRDGILAAAEAVARGDSSSVVIDRVCDQLVRLLGLERCTFDHGTGLDHPRPAHDGTVTWRRRTLDVDVEGLPRERANELLVEGGGQFRGRFLLAPRLGARPARAERLVAVALADQAGEALTGYVARRR
jgi:hypothetical protein